MNRLSTTLAACSLTTLPLLGCGGGEGEGNNDAPTREYTLTFDAVVGDQDFSCDQTFSGLGRNGGTDWSPSDFRLYIHDVTLVGADGATTPLDLDQDSIWQAETVALLDFEDASGTCSNGTPQTNFTVTGLAADVDYTAVRFTLGVPESLNHADQAVAASPLNITGMWWSWQGGYKFLKIDGMVPVDQAMEPRLFHLGSTQCEPDGDSYSCGNANRADFEVAATADQTIVFDVAALFDGAHLDADDGGPAGCMSGPDDPDCSPLFENLGVSGSSPKAIFSAR
jgi:uncharacterized repeat protein (TIGR04052 family)